MMDAIVFSGSTIQAWIFCLFLCVAAPFCSLWYIKKKTGAKGSSFLAGIAFSLLFSFIGGVLFNMVFLQLTGLYVFFASDGHSVYAVLYGAFSSGLMACAGSFAGLKYAMKKRPGRDDAFLFGLGKGSFECLLNGAAVSITNLIAAAFINSLGSDEYFNKLGLRAEELAETKSEFAALASIPGYTFIIHAAYLLLALCIHVATALIISRFLHPAPGKKYAGYVPLAFLLQSLGYIPLHLTNLPWAQNSLVLLAIDLVYTCAVVSFARGIYRRMA